MRIASHVVEQVLEQARKSASEECCGALLGAGDEVSAYLVLPNSAQDPRHHFHIAPQDLLSAQAHADSQGMQIVAFYHSHPYGEARASAQDLRAATPWQRMLIVAPGGDPQLRAYVYSQAGWAEEPIAVGAK